LLKTSTAVYEICNLIQGRHEFGAAMPGNHDGTAGIAKAGRFFKTGPLFSQTYNLNLTPH